MTDTVQNYDQTTLWIIIFGLAVGSFALRFVFIGLVGSRSMPEWLLRHLRYTAVAIIPALVTPLVIWPSATGGDPDVPRLAAATVTFTVGFLTRNVLIALACGAITLFGLLQILS